MSVESNKDLVRRFFRFISERDVEALADLLHDQVTAEANRVVISAQSAGTGARGVHYQNVYHIRIEIKDAKLHAIREMFDPYEVTTYLAKIA